MSPYGHDATMIFKEVLKKNKKFSTWKLLKITIKVSSVRVNLVAVDLILVACYSLCTIDHPPKLTLPTSPLSEHCKSDLTKDVQSHKLTKVDKSWRRKNSSPWRSAIEKEQFSNVIRGEFPPCAFSGIS